MLDDDRPSLDLDGYLARIEYAGPLDSSREALDGLHQAHATHIPFENIEVLMGRPVRLDLESLQAKLVRDRRGGYCFEQNTLFAGVLGRLGFQITPLAARVRWGATAPRPRTHTLLKVDLDDGPWIADVGFGGGGLLRPLRLSPGYESQQGVWRFRVAAEDGGTWVVQSQQDGGWLDLYAFTTEPQLPIDYELANYFTATHPSSPFTRMLLVQRPALEERFVLRDRELAVERPDASTRQPIDGDEGLRRVLAETFGLVLPRGTKFPLPEAPPA